MSKKLSKEQCDLKREEINSSLITRSIKIVGDYVTVLTKSEFECGHGHRWFAAPSNVLRGSGCPHCAGQVPPTITQINTKLKPRGFTIVGEYTNMKTKTQFKCEHGHQWEAIPNNVLNKGRGCPHCAGNARLTKDDVNSRLEKRGIRMTSEYVNHRSLSEFECEFNHKWTTTTNSVIQGSGCPHCAGNSSLSSEIVNSKIKHRGIRMIGEYTNQSTNTEFICEHNHRWEATPTNVMNHSSGCPHCAEYGYNPSKPGWIYVLKFANFIKYGITNDIKRRLAEHLKNGEYIIIISTLYEDGKVPRTLENSIKKELGGKFITKEQCPDGYTETLCCTKLDQLLETIK